MLRQQLEMDLAKQALAEVGATKRLDKKLEAEMEACAEKKDRANKLNGHCWHVWRRRVGKFISAEFLEKQLQRNL